MCNECEATKKAYIDLHERVQDHIEKLEGARICEYNLFNPDGQDGCDHWLKESNRCSFPEKGKQKCALYKRNDHKLDIAIDKWLPKQAENQPF